MRQDSILDPVGLRNTIQNRRAKLAEFVSKNCNPAYMLGVFLGLVFRDLDEIERFLLIVPETDLRLKTRRAMLDYLKTFQGAYLLPAAHADTVLDIAAGMR